MSENPNKNVRRSDTDPTIRALERFGAHPRVPRFAGKAAFGLAHVRRGVLSASDRIAESSRRMEERTAAIDEASRQKLESTRSKAAGERAVSDAERILRKADANLAQNATIAIREAEGIVDFEAGRIAADRPGPEVPPQPPHEG